MIRPCFEHLGKVQSLSKCFRGLGGRPRPSDSALYLPPRPDRQRVGHRTRSCPHLPLPSVPQAKRGRQKGHGERCPLLNLSAPRLAPGCAARTSDSHGRVERPTCMAPFPRYLAGGGYLARTWARAQLSAGQTGSRCGGVAAGTGALAGPSILPQAFREAAAGRHERQRTCSVRRFVLMRFLESVHVKFSCALIILLTNRSAHRDWFFCRIRKVCF